MANILCNGYSTNMQQKFVELKLKGPGIVYVDWANVFGWTKSIQHTVDIQKLFDYFKSFSQVQDIRFYFGEDQHEKSIQFLSEVRNLGYSVVTKPVKHILVAQIDGQKVYRRKCDFDMEISIDVHRALRQDTETFIFLSGDGDFAPLYQLLIEEQKQVIVVYARKHIGREIWEIQNGIFKVQVSHLGL